ncbi:MAG: hypothetical protein WCG81_14015 [Candidatus Angelobacter sp.]
MVHHLRHVHKAAINLTKNSPQAAFTAAQFTWSIGSHLVRRTPQAAAFVGKHTAKGTWLVSRHVAKHTGRFLVKSALRMFRS